jgi:hypothetical protein
MSNNNLCEVRSENKQDAEIFTKKKKKFSSSEEDYAQVPPSAKTGDTNG